MELLADYTPVLLLCLPGIWAFGKALIGEKYSSAYPGLGMAFGVLSWLLVIHVTALVFSSFFAGLWTASVLLGLLGLKGIGSLDVFRVNRLLLLVSLGVMGLFGALAFGWAFHDETPLVGHMSISAQILHDVYPPRFTSFPEVALRYHYGFNALVAAVAALTSLDVASAIDLTTTLCAGLSCFLLWGIGEEAIGKGAGWLTIALGLFSAGLPMGLTPDDAPLAHEFLGFALLDSTMVNPPVISYFFQHPWTLGIPAALSIIALLLKPEDLDITTTALLSLAFLVLSFTQVVLFVCLVPTAIAVLAWHHRSTLFGTAVKLISGVVVLLVVSRFLGGMWTPRLDAVASEFEFHTGVTGTLATSIKWHLHNFGVPLLLGVLGLKVLNRGKLLFFLLVTGSLMVINGVRYTVSWDILKFATVTQLTLGICSASGVWWLAHQQRKGLAVGMTVVSVLFSALFVLVFLKPMNGIPSGIFPEHHELLTVEEEGIATHLRTVIAPDESVLVPAARARAWAQQTGLGSAWTDGTTKYFGASEERIAKRRNLLNQRPALARPFVSQGVCWASVPRAGSPWSAWAESMISAGEAVVAVENDQYWVLRLCQGEDGASSLQDKR